MIQIPAKTFFLGEYLALKGGPSLIALTTPCFQLDTTKRLHPECVASRFWQAKTNTAIPFGLQDPFQGKGGMGASSAEFLLAYQMHVGDLHDLENLHRVYLEFAQGQGQAPSGYDVLAQTQEGISLVQMPIQDSIHFKWVFSELGFVLVHTGKKLATHVHLQHTTANFDWRQLAKATERGIEALIGKDADQWLDAIRQFHRHLSKIGLLAAHSQALIIEWQNNFPILAAKGCGAMGADVIALFLEKGNIAELKDDLIKKGFCVLATQEDLYFQNARE
ncbi:MAG: hypothetical protein EBY16_03485 [Gammaproteobacteria bacterium]|nr:hypothetical protein [Gammaproteobacteria bacterium]